MSAALPAAVHHLLDEPNFGHLATLLPAMKYLGKDVYPFRFAGQERVIIRIVPDSLFHREPTD